MDRKIEVVFVVLLVLAMGVSVKGQLAIDPYSLFDGSNPVEGPSKIDALKLAKGLSVPDVGEGVGVCPRTQGTHINSQGAGAEWKFNIDLEGSKASGYMYPEGNDIYRLEWLDFYGFTGCELHFLEMKLRVDEKNKQVTASDCQWYDGPQLESLSNLNACGEVPSYNEEGIQTGYVKQKSCGEGYRILNVKRCDTRNIRLLDPFEKGYLTRIEGNLLVAFDVGTPLSKFQPLVFKANSEGASFFDSYIFSAEYIGPEKPAQTPEKEPEKTGPTDPLLVASGTLAGVLAAGLAAKMIYSAHQKKMMAQTAKA